MSKPSVLFIPGSFSLPEFYDPVFDAVAAKGYEIRGLHLPSVGLKTGPREGAPPTMYDDAAFLAGEVEKLAEEGKDVILVAHSYGGVPMSECTKGLSKEARLKDGKKGGVVKLGYMTALVPPLGTSAAGVLASEPRKEESNLGIDEKGWMYQLDIPATARAAFGDLSPEEGEAWVRRFPRHSAPSFGSELTHEGYKDVPCAYLVCENDKLIPPTAQKAAVELIERVSGRKVEVTSIWTDHCPSASKPELVSDWILEIAAKDFAAKF